MVRNDNDELSFHVEKHDVILKVNSNEDREVIYIDWGRRGKNINYGPNGRVKLEKGLRFVSMTKFREVFKDFII